MLKKELLTSFQNGMIIRGKIMKVIASIFWSKQCPVFYVSEKIGKVGDWGYTTNVSKAIHLTPYWQKRFKADCERVGVVAKFNLINS
jgi:hypothetical protein